MQMSKSSKQAVKELANVILVEAKASANKSKASITQAKKKRKKNKKTSDLQSLTSIKYASAPVNVGAQYGPSYIRKSKSGVQAMADYDASDGSERVEFSDTFGTQIQAGSSTATSGFGSTATFVVNLSPNSISPRLAQYEELYQWYAIRELIVEYCPLISTATSVGFNIGITNNLSQVQALELGSVTAADVNELSPSMSGPVYLPNQMVFRHKGMKLFSTNTDSAPLGTAVQAQIFCILDGSPATSTVYGKLRLCGVVDFYKQVPPTTSDPTLLLRNRILHRLDAPSRQQLFDRYMAALIKLGLTNGLHLPTPDQLSSLSSSVRLQLESDRRESSTIADPKRDASSRWF